MESERLGTALLAAGVVVVAATLVGSALTAPAIGDYAGSGERTTLVGVQGGGVGWHKHGNVHLLSGTNVTWKESSAGSYFDVTMLPNGSVMAGFMDDGGQDCGEYEAPCPYTGFRIIDPDGGPDGEPTVVYEYSFPVRTMKSSEVHDVERLGGGEFLLTDMEHERIFIVEGGEVVWEWRASSLYEPPDDVTRRDWLHINDVDVIGEGRYLVSVRNANQLVVVQRGRGVVEVINEDDDDGNDASCRRAGQLVPGADDDVRCGDPAVLDHQHNPQWLGDGAVLVADSDNDRVVELHRTDAGEWEPAWVLRKAGATELKWPRDADRLPNGNTLVTDTINKRLLEVTESGTVVWSTRTERVPYEADRIPAGEPVGGPRYGSTDGETPEPASDGVPGLSFLLAVLRGAAPWLPYWFEELQLSLTLFGVALAGGGWLRRR